MIHAFRRTLFIVFLCVMGAFINVVPVLADPIPSEPMLGIGDLNGDGNVDIDDAITAMQMLVKMIPESGVFLTADVDRDGKIGLVEVMYILQHMRTFTGSGTIKDGETPIPGVTIRIEGEEIETKTTQTDEQGYWEIPGLLGEVTVTPEKDGYVFKPDTSTITEDSPSLNMNATDDHVKTFTLIVGTRGQGTAGSSSGESLAGTYQIGFWDPWTLWAIPAEGWVFVGWEISTSSNPADADSWQVDENQAETFHVWKGWPGTHTKVIAVFEEIDPSPPPPPGGMVTVSITALRTDTYDEIGTQGCDGVYVSFDPWNSDYEVTAGTTLTIITYGEPSAPFELEMVSVYLERADGSYEILEFSPGESVTIDTTGYVLVSVTAMFQPKK